MSRPAHAYTIRDLVRQGKLSPVLPTTDSGYRSYGTGRRLLLATDPANDIGVASDVRFPTSMLSSWSVGTIAFRFIPGWAANDNLSHNIIVVQSGGGVHNKVLVYKRFDNKMSIGVANAVRAQSAALSWGANTQHTCVVRWSSTGTGDKTAVSIDGVNTEVVAATGALPALDATWQFGCVGAAGGYLGPVILSPEWKSDAWQVAIEASGGAAFAEPLRLVRNFKNPSDVLFPLVSDSVACRKVAGLCPF